MSRPRTARMMKASDLQARRKQKFKATTDSNHNYPVAPNRLNRRFTTSRPNQLWVSDITYLETSQGWLCLTVIIDLFDRKEIGWAISEDMSAESKVIKAWYMAAGNGQLSKDAFFILTKVPIRLNKIQEYY